jgi:imidazolonepropionase-like amidohydrolase
MRNPLRYPVRKGVFLTWIFLSFQMLVMAQPTFPVNGITNPTTKSYAFTNATLVKDAKTTIANATLVIKDGKIVAAGTNIAVPKDAVVVNLEGKYIYPSFIDIYSDYGVPVPQRQMTGGGFGGPQQLESNKKGAYGWNQAIKPEVNAYEIFSVDDSKAAGLRNVGFGAVLTHQKDGIARGTGTFVTLANKRDNLVILKDKASAHYSLNKGTSSQSYPSSLMGVIALLRQSYYDAMWYKNSGAKEGVNLTLRAWNDVQSLPQIFEGNDKWNDLRAAKIGEEFGVKYIIKAGVNEYQRIQEMAATKSAFILPLNFPAPIDTDDPSDVRFVGLDQLKHWELAPTNPAAFEKAGIEFAFTTADLGNTSELFANIRKAIQNGLTEQTALAALTTTPAKLLGVESLIGTLEAGKVANFIITNGPVFSDKTAILQNWVSGERFNVKNELWNDVTGVYEIAFNTKSGVKNYNLVLSAGGNASLIQGDTLTGKYTYTGKIFKLSFTEGKGANATETVLSGVLSDKALSGTGLDAKANAFTFKGKFKNASTAAPAAAATTPAKEELGKVTYPFVAYGNEEQLKQEDILIKNATVWTNEKQGILQNTDVLIRNGKIAQIGKNLSAKGAKEIDGTGKHLTAGIIDEHSHIAAASINEGAQSVTSEVRISDNINPEDINIYRQLSGGVTTSHILHGSANTIGGQTQLIKLRWGKNAEELKFEGADRFIKFALGENVKRSSSTSNVRFPNTRMGVEQVLDDAFIRATDYQNALKAAATGKKGENVYEKVRRDLELEALSDIMNKKLFITMHSYVQSEIVAALRVAEKHGFRVNTLTHILEGYKVADKIKAHGANVSTFSDWWNYKMEVLDAQPYNAYIMQKVGLNTAINSDDAEMARRLNQEAAKSVKYGGMNEEDALKMVTLNPAKMMHVDNKVGSIKEGKDADLVLWTDHPLSIYAMSEKTIVDGIVYFDREKDAQMRDQIQAEKARLIKKMADLKRAPGGARPAGGFARPVPRYEVVLSCMDHTHNHGLLAVEEEDHQ